jgi:alkaline phosphatase
MNEEEQPAMESQTKETLSRRDALKWAATGALAVSLGRRAPASQGGKSDGPTRIIFMVSDGMSLGVPTLAEPFNRLIGGKGTEWAALTSRPGVVRGFFDTASLDSLVTDSAAASSAWGSGSRVDNGALNLLPDGTSLKPVAALAKEAGWSVGLVTTTRITHATPAGFAASVPSRDLEDEIARQYLERVDFLCGGGAKHFEATGRMDGRDLYEAYRGAGYRVVRERSALAAVGQGRVLGVFGETHLPFSIDWNSDPGLSGTVPNLAEMTDAALRNLTGRDGRFLLQVEGGRVDHAAHSNDGAAILHDQLAFDAALGVALRYAEAHPETLVIATTDHGNANMGLNGMGPKYAASTACFEMLRHGKWSTEAMRPRCAKAKGKRRSEAAELISNVVEAGFGFPIEAGEAKTIAEIIEACESKDAKTPEFDRHLALIAGRRTGIGWTSMAHTADWAPILAFGPGADRFGGLLRNTAFFGHLVEWMGGRFRNPSMTAEEALKFRPAVGPMVAERVPGSDG